jgi:hypothetical protein
LTLGGAARRGFFYERGLLGVLVDHPTHGSARRLRPSDRRELATGARPGTRGYIGQRNAPRAREERETLGAYASGDAGLDRHWRPVPHCRNQTAALKLRRPRPSAEQVAPATNLESGPGAGAAELHTVRCATHGSAARLARARAHGDALTAREAQWSSESAQGRRERGQNRLARGPRDDLLAGRDALALSGLPVSAWQTASESAAGAKGANAPRFAHAT